MKFESGIKYKNTTVIDWHSMEVIDIVLNKPLSQVIYMYNDKGYHVQVRSDFKETQTLYVTKHSWGQR